MAELTSRVKSWLVRKISPRERAVVYTAITDNYDTLKVPTVINPHYDYVAFVDSATPHVPYPWRRRAITVTERNPRVTSRYYKMHPHLLFPEYGTSIYVDASLLIKTDFSALVETSMRDHTIALFRHPERDCIYQEAKRVVELQYDSLEVVERQMERYRQAGYPEHNGLFSGGLIIRIHHDPLIMKTMQAWWEEIRAYSQRDQLSGPVVFWRNKLTYYQFEGVITSNEYLELRRIR